MKRPRPPEGPDAASRAALASIDALHAAEASTLNPETQALQRVVKVRKVLYYSILWPFGALARRVHPIVIPVTAAAALLGLLALSISDAATPLVTALLAYWGFGGITYHAISHFMASALNKAADSVGLDGHEVLQEWARQSSD